MTSDREANLLEFTICVHQLLHEEARDQLTMALERLQDREEVRMLEVAMKILEVLHKTARDSLTMALEDFRQNQLLRR